MDGVIHSYRNNFDALRLLLAFLVLLSHGRAIFSLPVNNPIFFQAELAVNGFFIISGFLISWSIDRKFDVKSYAIKRLARIYPLYFVVISVQLVVLWWFNTQESPLKEMAVYYFANLAALNFIKPYFGTMVSEPFNGSLWTIKVELMFYAVIPVYIWLLKRFGMTWLLMSFVAAFAFRFGLEAADQIRWARQIPGSMAFFIAGAVGYFYGPGIIQKLEKFLFPCLFAFALLLGGLWLSGNFYAQNLAYLIGLAVAIYMLAFYVPKLPVGVDISYGIYLWHVPVFLTIRHIWGDASAPFTLYVGGTLMVLLLSWLSAHLIEMPCIKWGHKRAKLSHN